MVHGEFSEESLTDSPHSSVCARLIVRERSVPWYFHTSDLDSNELLKRKMYGQPRWLSVLAQPSTQTTFSFFACDFFLVKLKLNCSFGA